MSLQPGFPLLSFPTASATQTLCSSREMLAISLRVRLVDLAPEAGGAIVERTGPLAPRESDGARDASDPKMFYARSGVSVIVTVTKTYAPAVLDKHDRYSRTL